VPAEAILAHATHPGEWKLSMGFVFWHGLESLNL